ncbi:hypothetical protein [Actinacidiphila sp. bgisy160]|uniref:hypothetical protein n=1 Tax=Actinacidiphila sp. bgisy160 TaxID=3413796 RepID=UPI003D704304
MPSNPYTAVHQRASFQRGPAKYHCCYICGLQASDWALNRDAGHEIKLDDARVHRGSQRRRRTYADSLDAYVPLCRSCHRAYDAGAVDRRSRWNIIDPDLRERARARVAAARSAWLRWRGKPVTKEFRECESCAGPFWTTRGDTWCVFCRQPDTAAIVGNRRPMRRP